MVKIKAWIKASEQECLEFISNLEARVGTYKPPCKYDVAHQANDGRWYVIYIPEIDPYITPEEKAAVVEVELAP